MASLLIGPRFVTAQTKEGLTRTVLAYQRRRGAMVKIINICQDQFTGEWVAWFYDDEPSIPRPNRRLTGGDQQ